MLFHPHEGGDRTVAKASKALADRHEAVQSIAGALVNRGDKDRKIATQAEAALRLVEPARYGFRSFDRQRIIPDNRVINRPNPRLWEIFGTKQVHLTALSQTSPIGGPAVTMSAAMLDMDHYKGSAGGRVFALWKDAAAAQTNVNAYVIAALTRAHGVAPDPVDVFAYVAALLAHPAYVAMFRDDLIRPGLRVPLTADRALFAEAATLGREVIWLHSFGERMGEGHPPGEPRLPADRRPTIPKDGAIPETQEGFPDTIDHDAARSRLKVGTGFIDTVPKAVWDYEVSGKQVLRQWFSYRKRDRTRPQIGDKRPPSPLQAIQPDHWLPEYTAELLNVLNVLGMLVEMEPAQADLLGRIVEGPLIPAGKMMSSGSA